jgi:hypothetical protein
LKGSLEIKKKMCKHDLSWGDDFVRFDGGFCDFVVFEAFLRRFVGAFKLLKRFDEVSKIEELCLSF